MKILINIILFISLPIVCLSQTTVFIGSDTIKGAGDTGIVSFSYVAKRY